MGELIQYLEPQALGRVRASGRVGVRCTIVARAYYRARAAAERAHWEAEYIDHLVTIHESIFRWTFDGPFVAIYRNEDWQAELRRRGLEDLRPRP